jgi:predicted nucleic acid-binding protein
VILDSQPGINSQAAKQFTKAGITAIDTALGRFLFSGKVDGTAAAIGNAFDFALMSGYNTFRKDPRADNQEDDLLQLNKSLIADPKDPGPLALKTDIAEVLAVKNREDNKQFKAITDRVNILQSKLNNFERVTENLVEGIGDLNEDELLSLLARTQSGELSQEELKKLSSWLSLPVFMKLAKYADRSNMDYSEAVESLPVISIDSVFNPSPLPIVNFSENETMSLDEFFNFSEAESYLDELLEESDDDTSEILSEETPEERRVEPTSREDLLINNEESDPDEDPNSVINELEAKIKELERKDRDEAINRQVALLYSEAKILPHEIYQSDLARLLIDLDKLDGENVINFSETGRSVKTNPVDIILKVLNSSSTKISNEIEVADETDSIETLSYSEGFSRESQLLHFKVEKLMRANPTLTYDRALSIVMNS